MASLSILTALGQEVTGIISPVSLCMALTVILVRTLNPMGVSDPNTVYIASFYYDENDSDPLKTKILGALVNGLIFVALVGLMTFVLVLLFKYGYTKWIYGYMGFAGFSIFFVLAGIIWLELLQVWDIAIDMVSFIFLLYNFSVVGVIGLFFWPSPILMKQGYLILTGCIVAYVFTYIPEWTTWLLLVMMALYDLCAVLTPGGPLKVLVELAQEREEDIPALIYEARPSGRRLVPSAAGARAAARPPPAVAVDTSAPAQASDHGPAQPGDHAPPARAEQSASDNGDAFQQADSDPDDERAPLIQQPKPTGDDVVEDNVFVAAPTLPAVGEITELQLGSPSEQAAWRGEPHAPELQAGRRHVAHGEPSTSRLQGGVVHPEGRARDLLDDDDADFMLPDSIKLGLGDFIFYSVLCGRAAMWDMLTAISSYLAIIAGLGMTLLLLALYRKALPALPFSIALGVLFYALGRWILEPFMVPLTLHLTLF